LAEAGLPIVGLEPSCLLALRDEYLYLLPDDPRARLVAERALTFEEFIAGLAERGELDLRFDGPAAPVLLHGHCHQKALVGTAPSHAALAAAGCAVTEVDSGCCGMAGSFGYEAEHYDISLKMAERRLLPAVREVGPETLIVAAGVSCRQQIAHGTDRRALHPVEVLRQRMAGDA
jgi:Fe-S oxidoreductase